MTMIPPRIKKLPGLRKKPSGYISNAQQGSTHSNRSLPFGGAKMVRQMFKNTDKSYTDLLTLAASQSGYQELGETLKPLMEQMAKVINGAVNDQYEMCMKKGFHLPKYYIHIYVTKDLHGVNLWKTPNVMRIRRPHCRITRPSPYQDSDHYLWSVENMDKVNFEWCIPNRETLNYILQNPNEFDVAYVNMLRRYVEDKIERIEDYEVNGQIM